MLVRPQRLILGPLRVVGRVVGYPLGWGQPPVAQMSIPDIMQRIPCIHKFDMSSEVERCAVRTLAPNAWPNDINIASDKVHLFCISDQAYGMIMGTIKLLGITIITYIIYIICRYTYFRIRRDFQRASIQESSKYKQKMEQRMERLKREGLW